MLTFFELHRGQEIRPANECELTAMTWGIACASDASLWSYVHVAWSMREQQGCRADAWEHLVTDLLHRDLALDVYDAGVEVLHRTAGMPCSCAVCTVRSRVADQDIRSGARLLPVNAGSFPGGHATVAQIRRRYDQEGRFRIRASGRG